MPPESRPQILNTASQVLHYLQANRVRVLVIGDSLQRQLHARLAAMFRGAATPVDYRIAGLARYSLCRAGDAFSLEHGYVSAEVITKQKNN